jgi:hypothetical protein
LLRLEDFYAGSPEGFKPYYRVGGAEEGDGDGDVFRPDNITELRRHVLENTDSGHRDIVLKSSYSQGHLVDRNYSYTGNLGNQLY